MKENEKEASKLLKEVRAIDRKIEEAEGNLANLKETRRAKYTRLNQLARQLKTPISQL